MNTTIAARIGPVAASVAGASVASAGAATVIIAAGAAVALAAAGVGVGYWLSSRKAAAQLPDSTDPKALPKDS